MNAQELNGHLQQALEALDQFKKNLDEGIEITQSLVDNFQNSEYVSKLFSTTTFGEAKKQRVIDIINNLKKISTMAENYVPTTKAAINRQIEINNTTDFGNGGR